MESSIPANLNNKDYRLISVPSSPSFLPNNLSSTNDGENFVFVNSYDGNPKAIIYGKDLTEKGEVSAPSIFPWKDQSDCFSVKYITIKDKSYLVICTSKGCQIYIHNASRQLAYVESKKKLDHGKVNFFTCSAKAYEKGTSEEFIATGTATGEIYAVTINGSTTSKELGFQMVDQSAITALASDTKTQTLATGNSNGYIIIFECDNQTEWKPIHSIQP